MNIKKTFYCLLTCLYLLAVSCSNDEIQNVNIPDKNFTKKLLSSMPGKNMATDHYGYTIKIDANNDGIIQESEAERVIELNLDSSNITSMEGIAAFRNLKSLSCSNNQIT